MRSATPVFPRRTSSSSSDGTCSRMSDRIPRMAGIGARADSFKPDYQGPERATMLCVYEGFNGYVGMLFATAQVSTTQTTYASSWHAQLPTSDTILAARRLRWPHSHGKFGAALRPWGMGLSTARTGLLRPGHADLASCGTHRCASNRTIAFPSMIFCEVSRPAGYRADVVPYTRADVEAALSGHGPMTGTRFSTSMSIMKRATTDGWLLRAGM